MRKYVLSLLAMTMIMSGSCTQEIDSPIVKKSFEVIAIMEGDDQTRSEVTEKGHLTWSGYDMISIFTTDGNQVKGELYHGAGTSTARFTYEIESPDVKANGYAVYPHNEDHSLSGNVMTVAMPAVYELGEHTANTNAVMLAVPSSPNPEKVSFEFKHLGAVIRFHLKNVPAGADNFVLSLGGKKINGSFEVDMENNAIYTSNTYVDSEKSVTLRFKKLTDIKDLTLNIPVPTGEYTGMELSLNDGETVLWTYSSEDAHNNIIRKDLKIAAVNISQELSGEGTTDSPYLIHDLNDLILFRNHVNAGGTKYNAEGVHVALADDIDMASVDWSVNIGDDCSLTFDGIFDGKGHVIRNLNSTETSAKEDIYICTGLFGAIYGSAVIKNLTIENVNINTGEFEGNNASAVVGFAYNSTGSIENVKVTGDIKINAPGITGTGPILGYDYYSPGIVIKNCEVKGNDGSYIKGAAYVGGVAGYASNKIDMNGNVVENIDVTANSCAAGGIAGIMLGGGSASDNTVKNVNLSAAHENWQNSVGVVIGCIAGGKITVTNTTFEAVTANGEATPTIVGSAHADQPTTPVAKVQARIVNDYYDTLMNALKGATTGQTITLLSDVELTESIDEIIEAKGLTIELNGFTIKLLQ